MTLQSELKMLADRCFAIEDKLPHWNFASSAALTKEQWIRKQLFHVRCSIGDIETQVKRNGIDYDNS